jgi:hypothetical protein
MRKSAAPARLSKAREPSRPAVDDPELRELLDHLGRLIAREYVAVLQGGTAATTPPKGEVRQ